MKPITQEEAKAFDREQYRKDREKYYLHQDIQMINQIIKEGYDALINDGYIQIGQARHCSLDVLNDLYNKEGLELYVPTPTHTCIRLIKT